MNYLTSELKVVGTRPVRPDGVDKVNGRALFAADTRAAGMVWGKIKRSPHAHARIVSIDTRRAKALPGVMAVVTAADFPNIPSEEAFVGEGPMNFRDLSRNINDRGGEVSNPRHSFGARGVSEVPIVPPMAAIANAIRAASGLRMPDLPISPPKLRAALDAARPTPRLLAAE
jgi:CO/xanthine dehydrogenase Mo-binding subunit